MSGKVKYDGNEIESFKFLLSDNWRIVQITGTKKNRFGPCIVVRLKNKNNLNKKRKLKEWRAYEISFVISRGWLPNKENIEISHLCTTDGCIHPLHIRAESHTTNMLRRLCHEALQDLKLQMNVNELSNEFKSGYTVQRNICNKNHPGVKHYCFITNNYRRLTKKQCDSYFRGNLSRCNFANYISNIKIPGHHDDN